MRDNAMEDGDTMQGSYIPAPRARKRRSRCPVVKVDAVYNLIERKCTADRDLLFRGLRSTWNVAAGALAVQAASEEHNKKSQQETSER